MSRARVRWRARAHVPFFFTVACVTYHFRVKWPCWTRFWPSNWFLNIHGCTHARFLTKRAHTTWKAKFKALYIDYQVNRHAELDSHLQSFFRKLLATFLRGSPQSARVHKALTAKFESYNVIYRLPWWYVCWTLFSPLSNVSEHCLHAQFKTRRATTLKAMCE